jgi:hypothetical protein
MLMSDERSGPFVAGADGCPSGWVALILNVRTGASTVQLTDVPSWIRERPDGLAILAIDIPIGLIDGTRPCDGAARKLLGLPRFAHVLVSKYGDHPPLYRQSQIYAREGVDLDRSTLAGWVGAASELLTPLVDEIKKHVLAASKIHADLVPLIRCPPKNKWTLLD